MDRKIERKKERKKEKEAQNKAGGASSTGFYSSGTSVKGKHPRITFL
jgi:hypothetical protein